MIEEVIAVIVTVVFIIPVLGFGIYMLVKFTAMYSSVKKEDSNKQAFEGLAYQLGFSHAQGKRKMKGIPHIRGNYKGLDVVASLKNGESLFIKTEFPVVCRGKFLIRAHKGYTTFKSRSNKLSKIKSGHKKFDKSLVVYTLKELPIRSYLSNNTRGALLKLRSQYPDLKIDENEICVALKFSSLSFINQLDEITSYFKQLKYHFSTQKDMKQMLSDIINDRNEPESLRYQCLNTIIEEIISKEEKVRFLKSLQTSKEPFIQLEVLYHLYRMKKIDIQELTEFLETEYDISLLKRVVQIIRALGSPDFNNLLLRLVMQKGEHQMEMIELIGDYAQVDAVEPLMELGKKQYRLKKQISRAILKIQSRLGPADKGWVSIAAGEDEKGALSVAQK